MLDTVLVSKLPLSCKEDLGDDTIQAKKVKSRKILKKESATAAGRLSWLV